MSVNFFKLYVPVTVHREKSVKKEYQQDAILLHLVGILSSRFTSVKLALGCHEEEGYMGWA